MKRIIKKQHVKERTIKGTYAMKNGLSSRVARATVANVYANDPNLPGKNFIDVSSWNGDISVAEYQKLKAMV